MNIEMIKNEILPKFFLCTLVFIFFGCTADICTEKENIGQSESCFAATILTQGNPFPNPVAVGGDLKLKMKIGAVDSNFQPISATISIKVFTISGGLVHQQTMPPVPPSSSWQNVIIWSNVNIASGTYIVELTIDVGECGSKTICLTDNNRIVVIK